MVKTSKFYNVYGESAYILYYLFSYKVNSGVRTGFPDQAINKVINALLDKKISYKIFENEHVIEEKDFKKLNNYDKYCKCEQQQREQY